MKLFNEIKESYGSVAAIQKRFGYSHPSGVHNWKFRGIPEDKKYYIHLDTGIPLSRLMTEKIHD